MFLYFLNATTILADSLNNSQNSDLIDRVAKLEKILDSLLNKADNVIVYLVVIFGLITAFGFALYRYGINKYKNKMNSLEGQLIEKASNSFSTNLNKIAEDKMKQLDSRSIELFNKIEEKHFLYMQITSLKVSGCYDEALEQVGWRGDYNSFMSEPEAFQRIIISCLAQSQNAQKDASHLAAWQWVRVLLEKNSNFRNMEAMLRIGIKLKHFDEAVITYDKFSTKLSSVECDECEPILFVAIRRARKPANYEEYTLRLKNIVAKHKSTNDIKIATNFAAFYRDNGQLEDADRLMIFNVQRLINDVPNEDGWERLFNTYIANCIDQGTPEKAIPQAKALLQSSNSPENIFTCTRLAWFLDDDIEEKKVIMNSISNLFKKGRFQEVADGIIKSKALLLQFNGKSEEALSILDEAINKNKYRQDKWSENNLYYFYSLSAQILMKSEILEEVDKSIELLSKIMVDDNIGEAHFYMAKACAIKGNNDCVFAHLEKAANIKKKWIIIASHDRIMKKLPLVNKLLTKYSY